MLKEKTSWCQLERRLREDSRFQSPEQPPLLGEQKRNSTPFAIGQQMI
jgi:hypothetical protein